MWKDPWAKATKDPYVERTLYFITYSLIYNISEFYMHKLTLKTAIHLQSKQPHVVF